MKQENNTQNQKLLLWKINKIDKPLAKLTKKRKTEKTQIANMKNESNATIIDSKNIKKIIKEYYKIFYAYKFDKLD